MNEMEAFGYKARYNYTQYAEDHQVNVIDGAGHDKLNRDVMNELAAIVGQTFGPYGKNVLLSGGGYQISTKDGWHTFDKIRYKNQYKELVLRQIYDIVYRMNKNVGDGTTSCILLTNHLYRRLKRVIDSVTPDEKRNINSLLDFIESDFHVERAKDLTPDSLKSIIDLAGNFDENICGPIYEAYSPKIDDDGKLSIADVHVVYEPSVKHSARAVTLPGKYRIPVRVHDGWGIQFPMCDPGCVYGDKPAECFVMISKTKITNDFMESIIAKYTEYDALCNGAAPPLVICSRNIMETITAPNLKCAYSQYCEMSDNRPKILPVFLDCESLSHLCEDVSAVMDQPVFDCNSAVNASKIDFKTMKSYNIVIYQGMSLGFMDVEPPETKIHELEFRNEIDKDYDVITRIDDLKMKNRETVLYMTYTSQLDETVVKDKVDDIVHVVSSAMKSGIIRNMLLDGSKQFYTKYIANKNDYIKEHFGYHGSIMETLSAIYSAMIDITIDLLYSKYQTPLGENESMYENQELMDKAEKIHSDPNNKSYNLITNKFVDIEELCTSSRYDEEVLKSSLATIRYLLDSGVMIFGVESFDTGHDLIGYASPK